MAVIPMKPILDAADRNGYGQGAFNVNSISQIKAAIEIHEILRSPAIIQGAELANGFMGGKTDFKKSTIEDIRLGARRIGEAVWKYGEAASIPIALHLDHGTDLEVVKACIDGGYTSVMIDGSSKSFEDNVDLTREVVKYAHARGVTVEGELGILAGVEDHVFSAKSTYTHPIQALEFVKKTGVDALAISYGTMHGPNKGKNVKLRKEIVTSIKEILRHEGLDVSLVSHGSSTVPLYLVKELKQEGANLSDLEGIPNSEIRQAIEAGISKINVDTDIRMAVTRNLRAFFNTMKQGHMTPELQCVSDLLAENREQVDPRVFFAPIIDSVVLDSPIEGELDLLHKAVGRGVQEIISQLVVIFGSYGKSNLVELKTLEMMRNYYIQN